MTGSARVVALGARTPVGLTASSSAAAVRAGIRRLREHPFIVDGNSDPMRSAYDPRIDPRLMGPARLAALAQSALWEAVAALLAQSTSRDFLEILVALPETRPGFSDADADVVVAELRRFTRLCGGVPEVTPAGRGHAGALAAIATAVGRVESGERQLCAVVGVDSYFSPDTIDWLDSHKQIAGTDIRSGFTPGEGAGCLVIGMRSVARGLRLPSLARVANVHTARETNVLKGPDEGLGQGLTEAIRGATATLRPPAEIVDDVYCDINGERYRADEWGFVVLRLGGLMRTTDYLTPAGSWGDVGAASGALLGVLAIRAWARGYAAGPRALLWCSSEGGLRAAALIESGEDVWSMAGVGPATPPAG
jgi:3-oxoacyl-[acyl-carrier-protein] synthase I